MTGPDDSDTSTRPISVAELLAKNGTIGAAPPGGGRRRRRRGNSDSVTVAELTGEIPIVRTGEMPVVRDETREDVEKEAPNAKVEAESEKDPAETQPAKTEAADTKSGSGLPGGNGDAPPSALADPPANRPAGPPELADKPTARRGRTTTPQRGYNPLPVRNKDQEEPSRGTERPRVPKSGSAAAAAAAAEAMSPDPIVDGPADAGAVDSDARDVDGQPDELGDGDTSYLQSYLRATSGPLFGGQTVADDAARRGTDEDEVIVGEELEVAEALEDHEDDVASSSDRHSRGQMAVRGLVIAAQSIVAVAFGAGLFVAFDQLWKWSSIVALVLGVLVILGLVVGVRVVRKTEDIGSTLTAVAVGALVTFGPLALLQAS
jgi:hypothetical protein